MLVLGGSQGAQVFNQRLPQLLAAAGLAEVAVWHQCGRQGDADAVASAYAGHGIRATVEPFIADMAAAYQWCDFAVCRAGAMTVSELCAAGVAALLVPYPYAVSDHQALNAQFMVAEGAAVMVRQTDFLRGGWTRQVAELRADRDALARMSECARRLARPDAAVRLADACEEAICARR